MAATAPHPPGARPQWVTFLSDYGLTDVFVGVCKGVIATIAPAARILDITHQVARQDVAQGAAILAAAVPYMPPSAVHVAMVDPLLAEPVRGVVVQTGDGSLLVGADNGLLSLAWEALGGAAAAYQVTRPELWLTRRSRTFRGRDMFSPVAAHLSNGTPPAEVGPAVDPADLHRIRPHEAVVDDDHVHGEVLTVDHFGNVSLNVRRADLEAAGIQLGDMVELRCPSRTLRVPFTLTYGDVQPGRVALCEDSFRAVMVAVNLGHAAQTLRVSSGDPVVITRLPVAARSR